MSKTSLNRQSIRYFASSICSHKYSKQTSGVTAGSLFLLVGDTAPQPPYERPEGFYAEYDLTSGGELVDLRLQLRFLYLEGRVKRIFHTIDPMRQ